ncbi:extracellular solute-binding protein [Clostridium oryzae]|uniref:Multiple sugar-binding protein n=1 Tax=Clostridium oryzae TaxID=1450648 RepID=A0A1V4I408_9CLOT|nr:extracellular solute-binding protein [Clostridium oryzae]OPJ54721.1 multiple sugar-binding protein precursor [Clostridium oryzae]
MNKTLKSLTSIALVGATTFVFAGCSSKAKNTGSASGKSSTVNLSYWNIFVGADAHTKYMKQLLNDFKSANPKIKITEQGIPNDQYKTKLQTQAAAKQLPDMFINWPGALTQQFANNGLVTDITDTLNSNTDWKNGFFKGSYDDYTVNGKVYSVPIEESLTSVVYYNKTLFDKYNLQYPKTFDDLLKVVKVFNSHNIIPISMGDKASWMAQSCIMSSMGDHMTGTDWFKNAAANKGNKFTDPIFIKALDKLKQLSDAKAFNKDFMTLDDTQQRNAFANGKAAMMIDGSWAINDLATKASADTLKNIEVGQIPGFTDGKGDQSTLAGATGIGVEINSQISKAKQTAALKFIQFITSEKSFETAVKNNVLVPYNVTLDTSGLNPVFVKTMKLSKEHSLSPAYDSLLSAPAAEATNNGLQSLLVGQSDSKTVAKQIQNAVESK